MGKNIFHIKEVPVRITSQDIENIRIEPPKLKDENKHEFYKFNSN